MNVVFPELPRVISHVSATPVNQESLSPIKVETAENKYKKRTIKLKPEIKRIEPKIRSDSRTTYEPINKAITTPNSIISA